MSSTTAMVFVVVCLIGLASAAVAVVSFERLVRAERESAVKAWVADGSPAAILEAMTSPGWWRNSTTRMRVYWRWSVRTPPWVGSDTRYRKLHAALRIATWTWASAWFVLAAILVTSLVSG